MDWQFWLLLFNDDDIKKFIVHFLVCAFFEALAKKIFAILLSDMES